MKKTVKNIMLFIWGAFVLIGCKEEPIGQTPTDSVAPGVVRNPVVKNIPGGAYITCELPDDDDLLCVKAVYTVNQQEKNTISSLYENKVKVEGYGTTDAQKVLLYAVDRSFNESAPIEVTIQPETPYIDLILQSIEMKTDFGGVQITWENIGHAEVAINLLAADSIGELVNAEVLYTKAESGQYSLRGFEDTERLFAVCVRDRWDNTSDTLSGLFTPFFEMKLEKSKWKREILNGDNTTDYNTWVFSNMYDDIVGGQGWHTSDANGGKLPIRFTIDLGVTTKLSRYKLWHRFDALVYQHYNPKRWKVYGCENPRFDLLNDNAYWQEGGYKNDWVFLGEGFAHKPSGYNNPVTQDDMEYARMGFEFVFPLDAPPVRYLRFEIDETCAGSKDLHIGEITVWGTAEE